MAKILDSDSKQIDVVSFLEDITSTQAENLLGGCCQCLHGSPYLYMNDNNSNKPSTGVDNKSSNQKINSIDNSKKTYINGVPIPMKGDTLVIYG
jgi:hypothetical protein